MVALNIDEESKLAMLPLNGQEKTPQLSTSAVHLKFDNLTVSVGNEANYKQILKNVSGDVKAGEILAVMGPSGAGKTTLMNVLAGRMASTGGKLEQGTVTVNNKPLTKRFRRRTGFVLQEDQFFPNLTMGQTLQFAAELRLPESLTKKEKLDKVKDVMENLGISKCKDTLMGGGIFLKGVSGGEKKRASIGVELLTNPALLLMDEPTSGLDSTSAMNLLKTLKQVAVTENKTIVATIHQPSSQLFYMFDKLLLLCNGETAYFGPIKGVLDFFDEIGMPCYPNWNPADYIMDMMKSGEETEKKIVKCFAERKPVALEVIEKKTIIHDTANEISMLTNGDVKIDFVGTALETSSDSGNLEETEDSIEHGSKWESSFRTQMSVLTRRAFIQTKGNVLDKLTIFQSCAIAFIVCNVWFRMEYTEEQLNDRLGLIFFVSTYWFFMPMFQTLLTFPTERSVVSKERAAGMYRLSAYYISKCISELPLIILQPIIFWSVVYWVCNLNASIWFLGSLTSILLGILMAQALGLCLGATVVEFKKALVVASIIALSFLLLGGFYNKRISIWFRWIQYLSGMKINYNSMLRMEFTSSRPFACSKISSAFAECNRNGTTGFITGQMILDRENALELWQTGPMIVGYALLYYTCGYLALKYLNRHK